MKRFLDRLRHRSVANAGIEHVFDFGIAARQRIADDDKFRLRLCDVFGVVSLVDRNPEPIEKIRHRRIDVRVRAAHGMALLAKHPRQRRHGCATNSDEVNHLSNRGLQKLEDGRRRGEIQTRAHTEGDDNIRPRSVSSREPIENRKFEFAEQIQQHFLQRVSLIRMLGAVQHLTENDAVNAIELSGLFQMRDHPVDLIRLGVQILENENRILGVDFVLRAESRDDERQTSADQTPFAIPGRSTLVPLRREIGPIALPCSRSRTCAIVTGTPLRESRWPPSDREKRPLRSARSSSEES